MLSTFAGSRRLYLILAVWFLVCGLAAIDLCDLSDELLQPLMVAESEIEALDDESWIALHHETELRSHGAVPASPQEWAVLASPHERRTFPPLYLQVSQYRI
jgi:hypothetical protein